MMAEPVWDSKAGRPGLSSLHQNKEFIKKLESFAGYELHEDGVSDYIEYCKATGLCGINFSVGFENEHTVDEFTDIKYLEELPSRILDFIKHLGNAQYALEYECSRKNCFGVNAAKAGNMK